MVSEINCLCATGTRVCHTIPAYLGSKVNKKGEAWPAFSIFLNQTTLLEYASNAVLRTQFIRISLMTTSTFQRLHRKGIVVTGIAN